MIQPTYTVWCDGVRVATDGSKHACLVRTQGAEHTRKAAWSRAQEAGWTRGRGRTTFCPTCAAQRRSANEPKQVH